MSDYMSRVIFLRSRFVTVDSLLAYRFHIQGDSVTNHYLSGYFAAQKFGILTKDELESLVSHVAKCQDCQSTQASTFIFLEANITDIAALRSEIPERELRSILGIDLDWEADNA